jgi:uncharacterized protein (DUF4213/DUF364 family)
MARRCTGSTYPGPEPPECPEEEARLLRSLLAGMDRPGERIERIVPGGAFVAVQAGSRLGLASTLGAVPQHRDRERMRELAGATLREAAGLLLERSSPFTLSLGLAAMNCSLDPPPFEREVDALEILADRGRGGEVSLVGQFPFTERLRREVGRLHLLELREVPGRTPPEEWDSALARSRVVGVTATALLTRSLAYFLNRAGHGYVVILGPSTPLTPVLFEQGVSALAGSLIARPDPVLQGIEQGRCYRELKPLGVEQVVCRPGGPGRNAEYPGRER